MDDRAIQLVLENITDDLLIYGNIGDIENFDAHIKKRFPISKTIIYGVIKFNGADICPDKIVTVKMSMDQYMYEIDLIMLDKSILIERESNATVKETAAFRSMSGELVWLGCAALPPAAYVGSCMQQCVPFLKVEPLSQANGILKELNELKSEIRFKKHIGLVHKAAVLSFSDADLTSHDPNSMDRLD